MAQAVREAMVKTQFQAIADIGYFNGTQIKDCHDACIAVIAPKPMTPGAKAAGRFRKNDFIYIARQNQYQCPAGQGAINRFSRDETGLLI